MKFNDDITLDIASAVSDVLEGKVKKEEVKYPHKMYHPKTGEEVEVMDKAGHDKYNKLGYVHEKPKNESPEEPRAQGEKEFKDKHIKKVSGMRPDGTNIKEDMAAMNYMFDNQKQLMKFMQMIKPIKDLEVKSQEKLPGGKRTISVHATKIALSKLHKVFTKLAKGEMEEEATPTAPAKEESEKQKAYQKVFAAALKKYGVKSPAELKDSDKKKEFFDYVDKNYEAENESVKEETQLDEVLGGASADGGGGMSMRDKAKAKAAGQDPEPRMKDDDEITKLQKKIEQLEGEAEKQAEIASEYRSKADDAATPEAAERLEDKAARHDEYYHKRKNEIENLEDKLASVKDKFRKERDK